MATIKLDDLNPANTFERRLLQFLVEGGTIPIKVEHVGQADIEALQARVDAIAKQLSEPQIITVSDQSRGDLNAVLDAIDAIKAAQIDLLRKLQFLAQNLDGTQREVDHIRSRLERIDIPKEWIREAS